MRKASIAIIAAVVTLLIGKALSAEPSRYFTTLKHTHITGFQGWFACPSDPIKVGWGHWFRSGADIRNPDWLAIDVWPDTSELAPDEKCPLPFKLRSGQPAYLFSDQNPKTVDRQFKWMQQYGLDGAAVQRFVSHLDGKSLQRHFDTVLKNVRLGAEAHRRGFFIMYDGIDDDAGIEAVKADWRRLTEQENIAGSPAYMFHRGKPVVGLWGIGFTVRHLNPKQAEDLISFFRTTKVPATVLGGVPGRWRTLDGASRPEREWASVYRSLDVVSPWTVGGFNDDLGAKNFAEQHLIPDLAETRKLHIDYMPVVWPGFSWHNGAGRARNSPLNQTPRQCGSFYKSQVQNVVKAGADMLYTAMFDEVNEGTAILKLATHAGGLPSGINMVAIDEGRCTQATPEMYLQLAGEATRNLQAKR